MDGHCDVFHARTRPNLPIQRFDHWMTRLNELLFSLNLSLLIVSEEASKEGSRFLGVLGYPLHHSLYPLLARAYHRPSYHPTLLLELFELWVLLAATFFVAIHLMGWAFANRALLGVVPGLVAVAGFPAYSMSIMVVTVPSGGARQWLVIELAAACLCVLLYFFRGWSVNRAFSGLIFGLHFGMWIWVSWAHLWFSFLLIYGLFGYCSAVVWGIDVSNRGSRTKPSLSSFSAM